ncbi:hypothetical protein IE81DRAFT_324838 [Ceraceosorus guamensis]|uniref:Protein PBN1 n=1 Tax=Ceraceosorus guamensis TaxID=1522189 RepID=A0A316VXV0_9BASI|nr:hypothetical protein IE81DRAFT_324838 [Ceraceosorus guamensis]PWN41223.1 hypothetical protein IE81DRAFT_324838 [Ceraceosorus guamensis]
MTSPSRPWEPATQHPLLRIPVPASFLLSPSYCIPTLLLRFPPALFPDLDALARQDLVREWQHLKPDEDEVVRVLGDGAKGIKWDEVDVESPVGWSLARLNLNFETQDSYTTAQSTSQTVVAQDGSTFKVSSDTDVASASTSQSTDSLKVPLALERRVLLVRLKQLDPAALGSDERYDDETLPIQLNARYLPAFSAQEDTPSKSATGSAEHASGWLKQMWNVVRDPKKGNYLDVEIRRPEFIWECGDGVDKDVEAGSQAILDEEALSEEFGVWSASTADLLPSPYAHFNIHSSKLQNTSTSVLRLTKSFHGEGVAPRFHLALPAGDSDLYELVRDMTVGITILATVWILLSFSKTMRRVKTAERKAERRAKGKTL